MAKNNKNEIKTNNNQLEQTQKTKDEKEGSDLKLRVIFVFFIDIITNYFCMPLFTILFSKSYPPTCATQCNPKTENHPLAEYNDKSAHYYIVLKLMEFI